MSVSGISRRLSLGGGIGVGADFEEVLAPFKEKVFALGIS